MSIATLPQAQQILKLLAERRLSCEQLQLAIRSGVLADVFDGNVPWDQVNRFRVREALRLEDDGPCCPHFKKWMPLGTPNIFGHFTGQEIVAFLKTVPVALDPISENMTKSIVIDSSVGELSADLELVTPLMLGFKQKVHYGPIFERAQQLGLMPCSPLVGPQLSVACKTFPIEKCGHLADGGVLIGMEPLMLGLDPFIFKVEKESGLTYLRHRCVTPNQEVNALCPDKLIAFVLPNR